MIRVKVEVWLEKKAKGKRSKTRRKLAKKGTRITVNRHIVKIPAKAKVQIRIDSSYNKSIPHPLFHGLVGEIMEKEGKALKQGSHYRIRISDKGKKKELIVHPVHLKVLNAKAK